MDNEPQISVEAEIEEEWYDGGTFDKEFIPLQHRRGKNLCAHLCLRSNAQFYGEALLWYFPEDRYLLIWKCEVTPTIHGTLFLDGGIMQRLWEFVEDWATLQFPQAQTIFTRNYAQDYETKAYRAFLSQMGYTQHPTARAAFWKSKEE